MKLLILLLAFLAIFFYYRYYKRRKLSQRQEKREMITEMVRDEICGVYLPKKEALKVEREGETHYFCSKKCKDLFLKNSSGKA